MTTSRGTVRTIPFIQSRGVVETFGEPRQINTFGARFGEGERVTSFTRPHNGASSGERNVTRVSVLRMPITNNELLEFALIGLEQHRQRVESEIAEVEERMGNSARRGRPASANPGTQFQIVATDGVRKRKPMSAAARKLIAAGQKRRWAAYHAAQSAT